ncbi:thioredoxin F, chloroplastic-like [Lolium rigidum]|uniref:thioredoxin F, chloroplastic-like n=1 Tax=Lolium rigidum TaxID=89674 RepID=UPI001F5C0E8A|nr:thioredoxin F, chloroplastic-like [Lolium rigidum]
MALRLSVSSPQRSASSPAISSCRPAACGRFLACAAASQTRSLMVVSGSDARGVTLVKSGGLETTATTGADEVETATAGADVVAVTGQVTDVCKDTFWPIVKAAGPKLVVLDMYTQWCGPCKIMAPKFQEMSENDHDVVFLKLDCNQDNRPLAKELGIRVVPTFKIFKDGKVAKEVTGAKIDELKRAIEEVKSS